MKAIILSLLCVSMTSIHAIPELQFLQIVFAHKTYAPISDIINSNDTNFPTRLTYKHFDTAPIDMPNNGKLNMYNLGVHLRDVYDEFLGDVFTTRTVKVRTAGYPLSMMSSQLVNAGLWPPAEIQKWNNDVNWQPIPSDYLPMEYDTLLLGIHCPSFLSEMKTVLSSDQMEKVMLHHFPLLNYVSQHTGMKIQQPSEVALLYAVLETKADLNESLPYWAKDVFPDGEMYNVTLLEYDILSQTPLQKQLNGGTFIKEIITNSLKYIEGGISKEMKLMMYSGNDRNIAAILKSLDLWSPHIPNEAASVIFEMYYDNETQHHGIKINYYTGVEGNTIPLTIPNCTEICPLKTFLNTFFDLLPQNEQSLCHWRRIDFSDEELLLDNIIYNRSESHKLNSITIIFLFILVFFTY
ncbi:PREDICTED: venom acid phosphatase Acph-1-like [Dufourea novaeangliae]|nr:PREDICTED: venom acid phosphatase Acph-1-like [Dufourea novaeangliae]